MKQQKLRRLTKKTKDVLLQQHLNHKQLTYQARNFHSNCDLECPERHHFEAAGTATHVGAHV